MSRFKVDEERGCWVFTGQIDVNGYGVISSSGQAVKAHRASYQLNVGPIPNGKYVLHRCDVRACINPSHLFIGSLRDNSRDMAEKGRWRNQWQDATHCKHGHEFTPENTGQQPGATGLVRFCRTCSRATKRRYKMKQKYVP